MELMKNMKGTFSPLSLHHSYPNLLHSSHYCDYMDSRISSVLYYIADFVSSTSILLAEPSVWYARSLRNMMNKSQLFAIYKVLYVYVGSIVYIASFNGNTLTEIGTHHRQPISLSPIRPQDSYRKNEASIHSEARGCNQSYSRYLNRYGSR